MKHVGFIGGSSMVELESPLKMIDFIDFLNQKVISNEEKEVVERLYKKYVRFEQLNIVLSMIERIKKNLPSNMDYFSKYLDGMETCVNSATIFHDSWKIYRPLRIGFTDIPDYIYDKERPLEQYDALGPNDPPFWVR